MLTTCKDCNGKGRVMKKEWGIQITCMTCKGKGGFDVPESKALCPECNGSKTVWVLSKLGLKVPKNCEKCFATGFIDKY